MKIKLVCNQQIGDCMKTTTVAKLFHEQYPHIKIETAMSHPCVYDNNPYIEALEPRVQDGAEDKTLNVVCRQDDEEGNLDNPYSIHKLSENNATFTEGMVGYINAKYGFELKVTENKPDIHLSDKEKKPIKGLPKKYWVVNTGGEAKNTRKIYPRKYWEEIFKACPDVTFVQTGISKDLHRPFEEKNVINRIDKDDVRETLRLIYHSSGVITPISFTMHGAAAFEKPCITLAGGGEHVSWENYEYDGFHYLHTIGSFPCCSGGGCWKDKCDNTEEDGTQKCMELIKPKIVTDLIWKHSEASATSSQ